MKQGSSVVATKPTKSDRKTRQLGSRKTDSRHHESNIGLGTDFFMNVLDSFPYPEYLIRARDLAVVWKNSGAMRGDLPESAICHSYIHERAEPCAQMGHLCLLEQARILKRYVLVEEACPDGNGGTRYVEFQGFPVFDSQGNLTYLLESRIDISKRKTAQQALYESEQKYRTLFQEANDAIFLIDSESGYIVNANREAERLLGISLGEILVMHQVELLTPQTMDRIEAEHKGPGRPGHVVDAEIVKKDGLVVPVCISSSVVSLHGRTLVQRVFKDMTEYRQSEARLMEYQKELRSLASQLSLAQERERRRIAAQVHDSIGQTMAVCSMKLGALAESLASTPFFTDVAEISALVKQTIDNARSIAYEISPPLLYEVGLEAAVERLTEQMKEQCGINFSFVHDGRLELESDIRITVFQALRELLVNAMKHSQARHVQIQMRKRGDCLSTIVVDDGVGFDTSSKAPGTRTKGYGLFSIRERLESVGGHIAVKSEVGKGTEITFTVPLKKDEATDHKSPYGNREAGGRRP